MTVKVAGGPIFGGGHGAAAVGVTAGRNIGNESFIQWLPYLKQLPTKVKSDNFKS